MNYLEKRLADNFCEIDDVKCRKHTTSIDFLCGSVDGIIKFLEKVKTENQDALRIEIHQEYTCFDDFHDEMTVIKKETTKDTEDRLALEKAIANEEKKERRLYRLRSAKRKVIKKAEAELARARRL